MNSTGDDLVEAPEDFFGNAIDLLDVRERSLRGGSWARSCSCRPRRRPPGEQAARVEHLLAVAMAARGHRRRVRRRRTGGACRRAGSRGSRSSKFLNLGRGLYLVDMPVRGRRAARAYGPAAVSFDQQTVCSDVPALVVAPSMGFCLLAPSPSAVPSTR